jgi:outer membrane receptor protein involved in Fe transport
MSAVPWSLRRPLWLAGAVLAGRGAVSPGRAAHLPRQRGPVVPDPDPQRPRNALPGLPFPFPAFGATAVGSEDLNSTYIKAYEFGYSYQKERLRLGAEFFWNNYRGIITPARLSPVPVVPDLRQNRNALDGDLYGFELTGSWQATDRLSLDGWYVWETWVQQGTRTRQQGSLTSTDLAYPPQQKVSVGARYELAKDLFANGRMWWVDEVKATAGADIDPYARFDFGVTKRLVSTANSVSASSTPSIRGTGN